MKIKKNKKKIKEESLNKIKNNSIHGITLIALVVTIIILIILAGVSINLLLGDNGIITKAKQAKTETEQAKLNEEIAANELMEQWDDIVGENPTLVSQIKPADYGKPINYSVTVKDSNDQDVTLTDWKVFYNDGKNVYIILGEYLNNTLIDATNITPKGIYQITWASVKNSTEAVTTLTNTDNWIKFATGRGAKSATGSPTIEMFVASWNTNPKTNTKILTVGSRAEGLSDSTGLYIPNYKSDYGGCYGYWLASYDPDELYYMYIVDDEGNVQYDNMGSSYYGVRPVVCLQSGVTGIVGDEILI